MKLRGLTIVFIVVVATLTMLSLSGLAGAKVLDTAEIKVKINVPVMQQLTVVEPMSVSFTYPWAGAENGEPLIFTNVGNIRVQSNASWALNIDSLASSGFQVFVKPAGDRFASWIPVNGFSSITGSRGSSELSWDVKIEPRNNVGNIKRHESVHFAFTMGQI